MHGCALWDIHVLMVDFQSSHKSASTEKITDRDAYLDPLIDESNVM
jgi:hypothetical protein